MIKYITLLLLILTSLFVQAQSSNDSIGSDSTRYGEVRSLLDFYEYLLNAVGSEKTSTRDKEVIITESFKKIFRGADVQIEDDLLENRRVITNKDVAAYFRDVDFFFQDIRFDFTQAEIKKIRRENESSYFLVSFESRIEGTTVEGESYKKTQKRFLEINQNEEAADLKIVSVYTTKISREKELRNWWTNLSYGWRMVFESYVPFDTISYQTLMKMASLDSLSLAGNTFLLSSEPLSALKNLRKLDISNTQLKDIESLRYSMNLKKLIARNTALSTVEALRYFEQLEYLDLSHTRVDDIVPLANLKHLTYLNLSSTYAFSFEPLRHLKNLKTVHLTDTEFSNLELLTSSQNLEYLYIAQSKVSSLRPLDALKDLKVIDASETPIENLDGLSAHPSLKKISFNRTSVNDLSPLGDVPALEKVYADFSQITELQASSFMTSRSDVLVVANSQKVMSWWNTLSPNWKLVFGDIMKQSNPEKEDLVKLINLDSLNLKGKNLFELKPLHKFSRMQYLDVSQNLFTDLTFTKEMPELRTLIADDLPISTTVSLENNPNLIYLSLNGTLTKELTSLELLRELKHLLLDNTEIDNLAITKLLDVSPDMVVIFQTEELNDWWKALSTEWKEIFDLKNPDSFQLHRLTQQQKFTINNYPITTITPLEAFINLKKIALNNTQIRNLKDFYFHQNLHELTISNGPLQSLAGASNLAALTSLNISNTGVDDLSPLEGLTSLRYLNCAGTSIKNLKGLSELSSLESLDVSNTRVWKLQRLEEMKNLKTLVCFNTRLRQHTVDEFKLKFPNCQVNFY